MCLWPDATLSVTPQWLATRRPIDASSGPPTDRTVQYITGTEHTVSLQASPELRHSLPWQPRQSTNGLLVAAAATMDRNLRLQQNTCTIVTKNCMLLCSITRFHKAMQILSSLPSIGDDPLVSTVSGHPQFLALWCPPIGGHPQNFQPRDR